MRGPGARGRHGDIAAALGALNQQGFPFPRGPPPPGASIKAGATARRRARGRPHARERIEHVGKGPYAGPDLSLAPLPPGRQGFSRSISDIYSGDGSSLARGWEDPRVWQKGA